MLSFVITQSRVPNLTSELAFIEEFMHKSLRFELQGCLLTHLQVALQFLKTCDIDVPASNTNSPIPTLKSDQGQPLRAREVQ